ncbi:bifunctional DNA-binding transcriptional regulator/O6-methylguanine-DNA methyltransferase Ada [Pseudomonas sp. PDM14]|uniref:bifunctional DNA-binding transcriptional regulator/O6-methylguanine-DNA methyltransferase Ada n=1 Tax=Pseudomonas sp. PDM14 TaxID=2769288 RepID=UPI001783449B|nr:bifunctional DNA-binding transcriptional regulator/O6-methylguanine-DNA methyltransferase Ada [Pseudomonas sp. PDM14]MBD9482676.1 bifunctional DNA-binding transcriptional regulator/O6-methylguanine-DNA methyltransferase Ada [Pseudomonas sp. PDM14]
MSLSAQRAAHAAQVQNDPRWASVLARDPAADGRFVFAVSSTGIYCRPSCPSRHAQPQHVSFHATSADAERAGFRPCKRCTPEQASRQSQHAELIANACRLIEAAEQPPSLEQLAAQVGLSNSHFHRLFKQHTGLTPRAYADAQRARRVRHELEGGARVTDAIYEAGFNSNGRFYAKAAGMLGMTPSDYRAGGAAMPIHFAIGQCSLGAILVAQSSRGVCAILLGETPEALLDELQQRFANAELIGADEAFEALVARVVGFVEAPGLGLDLPLDIRGTAFQQRVWQALLSIPPGSTASYAEIAERIGSPSATRAVAGACAANALAVAIPCHRVVRSDGALSGYRWGVERKRALLDREKVAAQDSPPNN